ncbi:MAG: copper resistance CopC/CopD family protein [Gemmatimonadaceae bacterium]
MIPSDGGSATTFKLMQIRLIGVLALAITIAFPETAVAHEVLRSSTPANGTTVVQPVTEIRLEFTEKPELPFTTVQLIGAVGGAVSLARPSLSGTTIVFSLAAPLPPGRYTVTWKTAGKDGHPVSGSFGFAVSDSAASQTSAATARDSGVTATARMEEMHHDPVAMPSGRAFDAQSPGFAVIRWAQFTALLILVGGLAFHFVVVGFLRRREPTSDLPQLVATRVERLVELSAVALLVIAIVRLIAQSYAMHGTGQPVLAAMWPMITGTTWGTGWILQVLGAGVVLGGLKVSRSAPGVGWPVAGIGVLLAAFSPGLSGHAASTPGLAPLAIIADAVHILGAGGWLGSLFFVLAAGIPAAMSMGAERRDSAVRSLVNAFSPAALMFAGVTATTGLVAAWLHIGSIPGLWETTYGRTLLIKLGILSVVVATGAYNWLRVKPALGKPEASRRLRWSATGELVVALLVIAVTAVLVATPTSMDEEMMRPPSSPPTSAQH